MHSLNHSESFDYFKKWLFKILGLNLIFVLIMSGFRVFSLIYYGPQDLLQKHMDELGSAFILGLRFDWSILSYFASIPLLILITLFFLKSETLYQSVSKFLIGYFTVSFIFISAVLAIDTAYYSYFYDHLNILVFGLIDDDTWALLKIFWKNYPLIWILVFTLIYFYLVYRLSKKILRPFYLKQNFKRYPLFYMPVLSLSAIVFISLSARGSLGLFPLGQTDAVISSHPFINHLAFNGVHALYRTFKIRKTQATSWNANLKYFGYETPAQAFQDYLGLPDIDNDNLLQLLEQKSTPLGGVKNKPHVLIIMAESFGSYYLDFQTLDFDLLGRFKRHTEEDLFFKNMLPSHQGTIGSISSLMVNAPQRPLGAFLTESKYLQIPIRSSPAQLYKQNGYVTRFIYGGNTGWRDIHKFARFQGFDHVEGDVDIEKNIGPISEKHDWGIYDEHVYKHVQKILTESKTPQFILILTTTNHPPYETPSHYSASLKIPQKLVSQLTTDQKTVDARFKVYRYATDMLGSFMDWLKSSAVAHNTLVAVTGDHSFMLSPLSDTQLLGPWTVPFYLYIPKEILTAPTPEIQFASHMDILPTLYSLSLPNVSFISFGKNLLSTPPNEQFSLHANQIAANSAGALQIRSKTSTQYFEWKDPNTLSPLSEPSEDLLKLEKKYRGLMGLLDYYFESEFTEFNRSKSPQN